MSDPEAPAEHNTTTTVTPHTKPQGNIRYDTSYIRKQGGILKAAQIVSFSLLDNINNKN